VMYQMVVLVLLGIHAFGVDEGPRVRGTTPIDVCGPRCVQFVLEYYGKESDLIDLTVEMQWPDIEDGTSMAEIRKSLRTRGVYALAVRVGKADVQLSSDPVIVHLKGSSDDSGHFLVWLPMSSQRFVSVWDGLRGYQQIPREDFERQMSGIVLLTSSSPILDIPQPSNNADARLAVAGVLIAICSCVGLAFWARSHGTHLSRYSRSQ